jgi:hypothetical protein
MAAGTWNLASFVIIDDADAVSAVDAGHFAASSSGVGDFAGSGTSAPLVNAHSLAFTVTGADANAVGAGEGEGESVTLPDGCVVSPWRAATSISTANASAIADAAASGGTDAIANANANLVAAGVANAADAERGAALNSAREGGCSRSCGGGIRAFVRSLFAESNTELRRCASTQVSCVYFASVPFSSSCVHILR